ncbi:thiamine pyrophosphate-binding protein [Roseateles sp. DXS20W]|uniref:Thiamine pyrophosphate-binding protein n=1 Tax=Pelomonas lactea TaxID=3299030 RepID=A0ABW7GHE9_9BURK
MTLANSAPIRVADYLIRRLADEGLQDIFLLPGGGAMHLNDAVACEPRITGHVCHHEQACGIAAEANGRVNATGFGCAMVTTGPGATNVVTPVAGAWIESLPLLVLSGQVKRADALRGRPLRQGGVQEVDIVSIVKPVTKFARTVQQPADIRRDLEEALWNLRTGRSGPVWLDVPLDVQAAQIDPSQLEGFVPPADTAPALDAEVFTELQALLAQAKRPLIIAGHGIRIAGGAEVFAQLAERFGIPCTFTWNAADLLPFDHPLYVGRPGVVAARAPNLAVQNCDLLISIGCRLDNIITAYNPAGFARAARKVVVDIDPHELARHELPIDLKVQADAKAFLQAWQAQVDTAAHGDWSSWRERCADWKARFSAMEGRDTQAGAVMTHYQFVDRLSELVPEDTLLVTGSSGLAVEVFYTVFRNKPGQRFFLTSGLGSMGYGLPAAIGACVGAGGRPTLCVESDGSLMLNLQELATLRQSGLPITLVVMNNNGYASIRNTQKNYFDQRYLGTGPQSGLWIPDFTAIAASMQIPAQTVRTPDELAQALADTGTAGPRLIDVRLSHEEILSPKVAAIPQPDGSMISMPLEDMSPLLPLEQLSREMLIELDPRSVKARAQTA